MSRLAASIFALLVLAATANAQRRSGPASAATADTGGLGALHFRPLGPEGNRVASITGVPGDRMTVYIGAADGGIWKTSDAGINWRPIFDDKDVSAIGALAVAPSAHDVVWAGTGEPWLIRPYYTLGDGVYKSTDAGRTWQHMGLDATGHIARIVIDPRDANCVYVCAIGQAFRPQQERGVFHTTDGGATWKQVLAVNDSTGCSDLAMDPNDSKTLFAGMWQLDIHRWDLHSGGLGSGVYVTHDGGATWTRIAGTRTSRRGPPARQDRRRRRAEQSESRLRARAGRAGAGPLSLERSRRRRGSSSTNRICRPSARRTTREWRCRRTMRICSTSRRSRSRCRATAARRCFRRAVAVAEAEVARLAAREGADARSSRRRRASDLGAGRRQSRRVDRSDERQPRARRQRRRRRDQRQPRGELQAFPAADLAGLSRDRRQRDPVQRDGQHPGQVVVPRTSRDRRRPRRHSAQQLDGHGRLRGRVRRAGSGRSRRRVVGVRQRPHRPHGLQARAWRAT